MDTKLRIHLDEHPVQDFLILFASAASAHLLGVELFQFLVRSPDFDLLVSIVSAAITSLSILVLKRWRNHWAWIALLGFFLLQLFCQAVHKNVPLIYLPAAATLFGLFHWARNRAPDEVPIVRQRTLAGDSDIPVIGPCDFIKAHGLVLFLSPLAESARTAIASLPPGAHFGDPASFASLNKFPWYMNLLAIHTHLAAPPLRGVFEIVLIPSADTPARLGTWRDVAAFRTLVDQLAAPRAWKVNVSVLDEHLAGVPYEDLRKLSESLQAAKLHLKTNGIVPVLVDITSGQATCSAVAASLTLQANECFQYVSTVGYGVQLYDLRYEPQERPLKD